MPRGERDRGNRRENLIRFRNELKPLTDNVHVAHLVLHGVRINLAHVPALVRLLDVFDAEHPRPLISGMGHTHPMVLRYDVTLDG